MRFFNIFCFGFFGYLIIKILCVDILKKYSSIKTNNNYIVFESNEFSVGDKMHFTIKSDSDCDDYLYYQYYDAIEDINYNNQPIRYIKYDSESNTKVNGRIKSLTRYFTIEKKSGDLSNLNGDFLYLKFNCYGSGSVTIENTESSNNSTIIIVVIVTIMFICIIGFIIWRCYKTRNRERLRIIQENYSNQYYPQMPMQMPMPVYPQYGNQAIVYQNPNSNPNVVYVNPKNANNYNVPQNMQVIDKGAMSGDVSQNSSNREV